MTGALLIADERREQIYRHKRTVANDVATNRQNELETAAQRLLTQVLGKSGHYPAWPDHWDEAICDKMDGKTDFEKIQIAGAFLAAALDRRMATGCGPGKAYDEFTQASRQLIEHLAQNHHPHVTAIVTCTNAHLLEGIKGTGEIREYIKD
jgi:hypothetical protein